MEREEWEGAGTCARCGAEVSRSTERSFAFGIGNQLCWECATELGGRYDARRETWSVPPDVSGIADEAYGAASDEGADRDS